LSARAGSFNVLSYLGPVKAVKGARMQGWGQAGVRAAINVADLRRLARGRLPRLVFDYLEGGAEDERGLAENVAAFARYKFRPRRLVDVSRRSMARELFAFRAAAPLVVGPTGLNGILWPDGDLALARAAKRAGVPFALSTASNARIEDVAKVGGELWFQLYVVHRRLAEGLVARASAVGVNVLVLTVDVAVNGKRERDARNGFSFPFKYTPRTLWDGATHPRWALDFVKHGAPTMANLAAADARDLEAQAALLRREMDATFDWDALKALRDRWPKTLLVKGVLAPEDAERCFSLGVDGVIVSNHGGRQVDSLPAPIDALARMPAAGGYWVDGGVRRGADIVKAVALGARGVLLGRAALYGLAAAGEEGAFRAIEILKDEIDRTLALIGCPDVEGLGRGCLDI
jgi:(S)-mandelate dehydrogenase